MDKNEINNNFIESFINNGAAKYLKFFANFFLVGFVLLFVSFKDKFYSIDFELLIVFSVAISSVFFLVFDIIFDILFVFDKFNFDSGLVKKHQEIISQLEENENQSDFNDDTNMLLYLRITLNLAEKTKKDRKYYVDKATSFFTFSFVAIISVSIVIVTINNNTFTTSINKFFSFLSLIIILIVSVLYNIFYLRREVKTYESLLRIDKPTS